MAIGDSKYRKSPMDTFLDRHYELTSGGLDPDLAYLQCQEEKASRELTLHLERYFCAQQAAHFYGIDDPYARAQLEKKHVPSAYEKARNYVMKQRRDQLASLIRMKKDAGPHAKVTREDLEDTTDEELYEYIRLHPEDANAFDETVFFSDEVNDESDEFNALIGPASYTNANDFTVDAHFGVGDYWHPSKFDTIDVRTATNQDLENIQNDTIKMLDHVAEDLGLDATSENLFDSLSETGRFEVLQTWTATMPRSAELLNQPYFSSRVSKHISQYNEHITKPAQNAGPEFQQTQDPSFMDSHIHQPFQEYSSSVSKLRTERAKRHDPLKAASANVRPGNTRL